MEFEGRTVYITNGYQDVYYPEHPNARGNGSVMVQVLVAEKILGRYLQKGEVVHHIDGNRMNNSMENLMVFATHGDHVRYHKMLQNTSTDFVLYRINGVYRCELLDVFFDKSIVRDPRKRLLKPCPYCGSLILKNSAMCTNCKHIAERKVVRPSKQELKQEIRTTPFSKLGEKYNVSDNAIRKWCKQYGLPHKSASIKKMSSEEWDKL